jgi:ParB/RepB/Spo0J family partition protein
MSGNGSRWCVRSRRRVWCKSESVRQTKQKTNMSTKKEAKMWVALSDIKPNPKQPRTYFDPEELERLGKSLQSKQNQPVTVVPMNSGRWMIVDGERRWRAAQAVGLARLWVVVDDDVTTAEQLHSASFTANWCRAGHTHEETANAIEIEVQNGKTYEEIGAMVGKSADWAKKEHSLLELAPEVMALLNPPTPRAERIPLAVAFLLTGYERSRQMKLWNQHKAKGRNAFHHIRTGAVKATARTAGDDQRYISGKARQAAKIMALLIALPGRVIGNLSSEERLRVARDMRETAKQAIKMAELLEVVAGAEMADEQD